MAPEDAVCLQAMIRFAGTGTKSRIFAHAVLLGFLRYDLSGQGMRTWKNP